MREEFKGGINKQLDLFEEERTDSYVRTLSDEIGSERVTPAVLAAEAASLAAKIEALTHSVVGTASVDSIFYNRLSSSSAQLPFFVCNFTSTFVLGLAHRSVSRVARTNCFEAMFRV